MTTLTEVFPCFFLSCKACVVLCIVCFVTYSVLFVCICVLNNCHRVATQLQLNMSYHFGEMCFRINDCSILKMEAICFSETSVDLYQTARRNISEQGNFQSLP